MEDDRVEPGEHVAARHGREEPSAVRCLGVIAEGVDENVRVEEAGDRSPVSLFHATPDPLRDFLAQLGFALAGGLLNVPRRRALVCPVPLDEIGERLGRGY